MWKNYHQPTTVDEVLALLQEYQHRARIVAGATDLLLELERGKRPDVDTLIDVTRIAGLDLITEDVDTLHLGALTTHNHVVDDARVRQWALPLVQACWEVGAPQIRNRATVAGNVITGSPANDTITPLWALGASVTLQSQSGTREVPLSEFYTGIRQTVMRPDEFLTRISVPKMEDNQRGVFLKLGLRQAQAIAVLNIAAVLTFEDEIVSDARIALGSVAPTILRVPEAEGLLIGKPLTEENIRAVAKLIATIPQPIDDVRGSAAYRTEMLKVLAVRTLRHLRDQTHTTLLPENPAMLWGENPFVRSEQLMESIAFLDDSHDAIVTTINGKTYVSNNGLQKSLLDFMRYDLMINGAKEGCAEGECGACTIFLDGAAVMACMIPAPRAHLAEVVTIEGLAPDEEHLHPLQQAFIETGAVQCGFCIPGFLMAGAKLLEEHPTPTNEQIAQSISGNLCRCTGYYKILEAFQGAKAHGR